VNHYLVKQENRAAHVHKRYASLEEAYSHCLINTRANEGKPMLWWVRSNDKVLPDGFTVDPQEQ
jgi:hypothetical protein